MKPKRHRQRIEDVLLQEITDRESMNPDHYRAAKESSLRYALAIGIAPEVVARLYNAAPR